MVKFIHLSDLHIHGSMQKDDNINAKKVVNFIINRYANEKKPVILITGDIVDDGKKRQYKNTIKILGPLLDNGFKILAVPGNHDHGKFGNIFQVKSRNYFRHFILGELQNRSSATDQTKSYTDLFPLEDVIEDVLFVGLDSSIGNFNDELTHFASGEVGRKQREKTYNILKDPKYSDKKKVIYFHHHPFIRGYTMEMDDAKEVMQLIAGNIDICCFGHKHKSETWSSQNDVDWIIASGKSSKRNSSYKFQYREITIDGEDNYVSMVTFKAD